MKKIILVAVLSITLGGMIVVGLLTITIPQKVTQLGLDVEEYEAVNKEDYKFEETKELEIDNVQKKYEVTQDDLASYMNIDEYNPGNFNPFTPTEDLQNNDSNSDDTGNNNDSNDNNNDSNDSNNNDSNDNNDSNNDNYYPSK